LASTDAYFPSDIRFFSTKKVCLILPVENKVFCLSGNPSLTRSIPLAFRC
jgi:hypothetical protein